jgi:hypothetical protein
MTSDELRGTAVLALGGLALFSVPAFAGLAALLLS